MRIPSQFNDDTLYGRRAKRPDSSGTYRRLLRLAVALVLVIVLMGQAAQPRVWRIFFGDPQAEAAQADAEQFATGNSSQTSFANTPNQSQNQQPGQSSNQLASADQQSQLATSADSIPAEVLEAARALTRQQSVNEQRQWVVVLDRWQSGASFPLMRSVVPGVIGQVRQSSDFPTKESDVWIEMLNRFDDRYGSGGIIVAAPQKPNAEEISAEKTSDQAAEPDADSAAEETTVEDALRLNAWLIALDQAAVDRVIDGSVWRSQDLDAFYRQLDQADKLRAQGALAVSVVPLMQQPKTYLGSRVRVRGSVASAEKKTAGANPFGVTEYWELWVKPADGGDRPMVLILPDVPKSVRAIESLGTVRKGPAISVVGRFFKRLAYPSGIGADAAPVVVGRVLGMGTAGGQRNAAANGRSPAGTTLANKSLTGRLWMTLGAALVLGISFSAAVMWRTSVMAKQSREIRNSRTVNVQLPDETTNLPAKDSADQEATVDGPINQAPTISIDPGKSQ